MIIKTCKTLAILTTFALANHSFAKESNKENQKAKIAKVDGEIHIDGHLDNPQATYILEDSSTNSYITYSEACTKYPEYCSEMKKIENKCIEVNKVTDKENHPEYFTMDIAKKAYDNGLYPGEVEIVKGTWRVSGFVNEKGTQGFGTANDQFFNNAILVSTDRTQWIQKNKISLVKNTFNEEDSMWINKLSQCTKDNTRCNEVTANKNKPYEVKIDETNKNLSWSQYAAEGTGYFKSDCRLLKNNSAKMICESRLIQNNKETFVGMMAMIKSCEE